MSGFTGDQCGASSFMPGRRNLGLGMPDQIPSTFRSFPHFEFYWGGFPGQLSEERFEHYYTPWLK